MWNTSGIYQGHLGALFIPHSQLTVHVSLTQTLQEVYAEKMIKAVSKLSVYDLFPEIQGLIITVL